MSHALRGFSLIVKEEPNLRLELCAAIVVTGLGFWFGISVQEWCIILLCIGSVLSAEAMNSSIERMADHITKDHHPEIGEIKDVAAAAVFILAVVSVVIGGLIFGPKIL